MFSPRRYICGSKINSIVLDIFRVFTLPIGSKLSADRISMSDIKSVYPGHGLSDVIIDLYVR